MPKTQHLQSVQSTFIVTYVAILPTQIWVVPYCARANAERANFLFSHKKLDMCWSKILKLIFCAKETTFLIHISDISFFICSRMPCPHMGFTHYTSLKEKCASAWQFNKVGAVVNFFCRAHWLCQEKTQSIHSAFGLYIRSHISYSNLVNCM